jgi:hypothetical protein
MRISTVLSRLTALSLGIFSLMPVNGQQGDVWVNLLEQDDYALRTGTVRRVDRQEVAAVLALSFDRANRMWILTTAQAGDLSLPISEIAEITFEQSLRKSSPAVQECPSEVVSTPQDSKTKRLPPNELYLERSKLLLHSNDVESAKPGVTVEVQKIAYDKDKNVFQVTFQAETYQWRRLDCGNNEQGRPGAGKGPG